VPFGRRCPPNANVSGRTAIVSCRTVCKARRSLTSFGPTTAPQPARYGRVLALYHDACVTSRSIPTMSRARCASGGGAQRERLARFLSGVDGALDDGAIVRRARSRIETGWAGCSRMARGNPRARERRDARLRRLQHFWVEDGLIRRQRSIAAPTSLEQARERRARRRWRQYPSRPIVGVGAVIFVDGRSCSSGGATSHWRAVEPSRRYGRARGDARGGRRARGSRGNRAARRGGPIVEVFDRILLDEARQVGSISCSSTTCAARWAGVSRTART